MTKRTPAADAAPPPEDQAPASAPETPAEGLSDAAATPVAETLPEAPAAAPDAQGGASDPNPDANPPQAEPTEGTLVIRTRTFPGIFLTHGGRARRAIWAPGYELVAAANRGRSGGASRILTTGSRAGLIDWQPRNLADDLLADDWEVHITPSQLEAFEAAMRTADA